MRRTVLVPCFLTLSGAATAQDAGLKKAIEANTKAVEALTVAIGKVHRPIVLQSVSPNPSLRKCPSGAVRDCAPVADLMCVELGFKSGKAVQVWGDNALINAICTD
jgi:hypothetical protein